MATDAPDNSGADADAAWARVAATVRPLKGRRAIVAKPRIVSAPIVTVAVPRPAPVSRPPVRSSASANTLDGRWDKRLERGAAAPDMTIDLHGHTLAGAHAALDTGLAQAIARGARLVLLVTGRPPPPGRSRLDDPLRGIIRASVGDWLHHSPHARRIAAVRAAHPRHGGAGALYLVLRRVR